MVTPGFMKGNAVMHWASLMGLSGKNTLLSNIVFSLGQSGFLK